ncbi:MAG: polyprenyl synthetase family protein [Salibacteraceae bacterium]
MTDFLVILRKDVEEHLSGLNLPDHPANLYEPIRYMLDLGGKRVRPILALLACELMGKDRSVAIDQALAVEIFHNFTLVHDDVMDSADLRRKVPTVHKKWNQNIALLSGDGMLVVAYQKLWNAPNDKLRRLGEVFSKVALKVCEGQQLDMDFASRSDVSLEEYLEMIRLKTAVLLGASMQLGAIMADAGDDDINNLDVFAMNLGMAFQIRDDYLDSFGNQEQFGKQIGGDIREGKRTWLTIKAFELANESQLNMLTKAFQNEDQDQRIKEVIEVYVALGIDKMAQASIVDYSSRSIAALNKVNGEKQTKKRLEELVAYLIGRQS